MDERGKCGYPYHEDRERTWFAGWASDLGVMGLGLGKSNWIETVAELSHEYSRKNGKRSCPFKFPLSDSQFEILARVCQENNAYHIFDCILAFCEEEIEIMEGHPQSWRELRKILSTEKK